jgi:hypothetical protein
MEEQLTQRTLCPTCEGERVCLVHGQFVERWSWEDENDYYVNGENDHRILQCRGCETVFYHKSSWNSEEWEERYHPHTGEHVTLHPLSVSTFPEVVKPGKKRPDWYTQPNKIEPRLGSILREMYDARDTNSFILASIGLRTAFDRASELLGVPAEDTFESKVKTLFDGGYIGVSEADALKVVADAGSAAAHRAWSPTAEEFDVLLMALEHFLERNLVAGNKARALASSIPPRAPRKSKGPKSAP